MIFTSALKKANVDASNSIMIGDTFEADILGAESVGMKTLFYNHRKSKIPACNRVIYSLEEIRNFL